MKKISLIVGARPNFMKAFPVYESLKNNFELTLIHTGQHFDEKMSKVFFDELGFPKPNIHFDLTSKSRAGDLDNKLYVQNKEYLKNIKNVINDLINYDGAKLGQLGEIRDKLYNHFEKSKPDLVIVFGDVTSTLSASLACQKLNIEIAHVESGLRSGDLSMPEEVNRILTDNMSSYFFVTEQAGVDNLKNEGIVNNVFLVGNTMIDTQKKHLDKALNTKYNEKFGLKKKDYILITLHRPSNVDDITKLKEIFDDLFELSKTEKLVYPIHPRTKINLEKIGYLEKIKANKNIILDNPLGYLEFTCLIANCKYLITDSGGLQEESTALNIPCFTLRENTERPCTLIQNKGTNQMINKINNIKLIECQGKMELWDGESSNRINNILCNNDYKFITKNIINLSEIKNDEYHYIYKNIDFLYKKNNKNKNLVVAFHGAKDIKMKLPIFRGFNLNFNNVNSDLISFSDPLFKYYENLLLGWFLSSDKINTIEIIVEIITDLKKNYNNILFFGSSGGGYISLFLSSYFNEYCLITNPQIYLEKYPYFKSFSSIVSNYKYKNIEKIFLKTIKPKLIIYYQNKGDLIHYNDHFNTFLNFLNENNFKNIEINTFSTPYLTDSGACHGSGLFPDKKNIRDIIELKINKYF